MKTGPKSKPIEERFWNKVNKTNKCWEWTGGTSPYGYGKIKIPNGNFIAAHRLSWEIHFDKIPKNICVCHKCDNRICIRPDHLFLGTNKQNSEDMVNKKRQSRKEKRPDVKLTEAIVKEMRDLYYSSNDSFIKIGKKFGVSGPTAFRAIKGHTWRE